MAFIVGIWPAFMRQSGIMMTETCDILLGFNVGSTREAAWFDIEDGHMANWDSEA
jgi:hypothetical protein